MKKLFILAVCLVASSVFAVPQIEYKNYKFVVSEAGYVDLSLSFTSTATSGGYLFKDKSPTSMYGFVYLNEEPNPGFLNMGYSKRIFLDAGEAFGAWATVSMYDPTWSISTYTAYLLISPEYLRISQYDMDYGVDKIIVNSDTSISAIINFPNAYYYTYYDENWDQWGSYWDYENVTATFTFNWTPEGGIPAPSGQPLPGIIPALLLGAGVYAARRKKKMAA